MTTGRVELFNFMGRSRPFRCKEGYTGWGHLSWKGDPPTPFMLGLLHSTFGWTAYITFETGRIHSHVELTEQEALDNLEKSVRFLVESFNAQAL